MAANQTPAGKAKRLWSAAKKRAAQLGVPFDLTQAFVAHKLASGFCEATGLRFQFETSGKRFHPGPRAPSLDRIVASEGYTMNNIRAVVWQFNLARNDYDDTFLFELAEAIAKRRSGRHLKA